MSPQLENSVISDAKQDHYRLITWLYLTVNSGRAVRWRERIKGKRRKEPSTESSFLCRAHPGILMNFFFRWCQLTETTITPKEQNNYVKEILSVAQAAY